MSRARDQSGQQHDHHRVERDDDPLTPRSPRPGGQQEAGVRRGVGQPTDDMSGSVGCPTGPISHQSGEHRHRDQAAGPSGKGGVARLASSRGRTGRTRPRRTDEHRPIRVPAARPVPPWPARCPQATAPRAPSPGPAARRARPPRGPPPARQSGPTTATAAPPTHRTDREGLQVEQQPRSAGDTGQAADQQPGPDGLPGTSSATAAGPATRPVDDGGDREHGARRAASHR